MSSGEQNVEQQVAVDEDEDHDRKLFVGRLNFATTEDVLREYFEQFGEVVNATLIKDRDIGRSRGFGFVVYAAPEGANKALAVTHDVDGSTLEVKLAKPKKVFISRVDPAVKEEEIKAYLETFGPVEKLEQSLDEPNEQRRDFIATFKKSAAAKKCLDTGNHKIGTQEVEITTLGQSGAGNVRGGPGHGGFSNQRGGGGYLSGPGRGGYPSGPCF